MALNKSFQFTAPNNWLKIQTIDMHTGGEPLRVITGGLPDLIGKNVLEKRRYFRDNFDYIRTGLMWEPRGHADMYGAVITESTEADFDVFFLHNEGYSTMCGHAVIALTKLVFEAGLVKAELSHPKVTFQVPCGKIEAEAEWMNGRIENMRFLNVPSFLYSQDQEIEVPTIGKVNYDIAYGGAFYAFVNADALGLAMVPHEVNRLIDVGRKIKHAVMDAVEIKHPYEDDLSFLYGTIFTGKAHKAQNHSRNVCIFADGEVDRSSTGSGVSARVAIHVAKDGLKLNQEIKIESITDSIMTVQATATTQYAQYQAVVPMVGGTASITGQHEFYFDPSDPFKNGFLIR